MTTNRAWLLGLLSLPVCLWSWAAEAKPRWPRASWTGPTHTTLTASWTDDAPGTGAAEIRPVAGTATSVVPTSAATGASALGATFVARFTGLSPSTAYEYRVQSAGVWSAWYPLRTAPPPRSCAPVRFVVGGDSRGEEVPILGYRPSAQFGDVMGSIAAQNPLLVIHTGDFVRTGDKADQWAAEMPSLERVARSIPWFMTVGNHDDGPGTGAGARFNSLLEYPADGTDKVDDYYSLVVGNVLFVALSNFTYSFDAQITWLEGVLAAHKTDVDWRVVFFHVPVWSSGAHGSNEGDKARAAKLVPVLDAYGVDMVINGHDHDYERFHPSKGGFGGIPRTVTPLPLDGGRRGVATGTTYVVSGGAGALVNPIFSPSSTGSAKGSNHLHYVIADVSKDQLKLTVRDCGVQGLGGATCSGDIEVVTLEKASVVCDPGGDAGDAGAEAGPDATAVDAPGADVSVDDTSIADAAPPPDSSPDASIDDARTDAAAPSDEPTGGGGACGCGLRAEPTLVAGAWTLAGLGALALGLLRRRARARDRRRDD